MNAGMSTKDETERDLFACFAMQALITRDVSKLDPRQYVRDGETVGLITAQKAYAFADAMLAERKERR